MNHRLKSIRWVAVMAVVAAAMGPGVLATIGAERARAEEPPAMFDLSTGGGWSMSRLDLDIHLDPEARTARFEGRATVRLDIEQSPGPAFIVNFANPIMTWVSLEGPEGAQTTIGERHPLAPASSVARLTLAEPGHKGDVIKARFVYESKGEAFQYVISPEAACASWVATWCPASLPGPGVMLSQTLLNYPGSTTFHMPRGWRSVSNGKMTSREETAAGAVETWESDLVVARSFAAAPYTAATHNVNGRTIGVFLLSEKPQSAESQVEQLAAALAAQEARFGPYPYPSYAIAEIPEAMVKWYASSEQGFIMAKTSAFEADHGNLPLWAHEMAHGWWGNLVTTDGPGARWMSESLAQYSAVVAIETVEGPEAAAEFLEYSRSHYNPIQCALGYFSMWRDGLDMPLSEMGTRNKPFEHNLSDAKGHWVYHMLRHRMGDDAFFSMLRGLIADFAGKSVTMDEIRKRSAAAAPDAQLETFFAQWLDRTGAPVIDIDWWSMDRGKKVKITLTQRQEGEPYTLPLEIAVDLKDGGEQRFTLDVNQREHAFELETTSRPIGVRLDPDRKTLLWRPEYGERPGPPVAHAASAGSAPSP